MVVICGCVCVCVTSLVFFLAKFVVVYVTMCDQCHFFGAESVGVCVTSVVF